MGSPSLPRPDKPDEGGEKLAMGARKSQVIEEEEEAGSFHTEEEVEVEEYIEEVDTFSPVDETSPTSPGPERRESLDRDVALAALTGTVLSRADDRGISSSGTGGSTSGSADAKVSEERGGTDTATASLLPAAEIQGQQEQQQQQPQPQLTPFQPMARHDAEGAPIHPPRSSSIPERKPGTPGSIATVESRKADDDKPLPPPAEEKPDAEKAVDYVEQKTEEK